MSIKQTTARVGLCGKTTNMGKLGAAIPFFFDYVKFCICVLAVCFVLLDLYLLVRIGSGTQTCRFGEQHGAVPAGFVRCGGRWKFFLSKGNDIQRGVDTLERVLFAACFCAMLAVRVFYTVRFAWLEVTLDRRTIDITDFTVLVTGLPKDASEQQVRDFFERQAAVRSGDAAVRVKVEAVNLVFTDYDRLRQTDVELKKMLKQYRSSYMRREQHELDSEKEQFKAKAYEALQAAEKDFPEDSKQRRIEKFTGVAFVSFETEEMAEAVQEQFKMRWLPALCSRYLGSVPDCVARRDPVHQAAGVGAKLYTDRADPPNDVIWENLGASNLPLLYRKMLSLLGLVLVFGVSLGTLVLLKLWQSKTQGSFWVSLLISIVIKISNSIFSFLNQFLVKVDKCATHTMHQAVVAWRGSLLVFLNSAIQLVLLNLVVSGKSMREDMWGDAGLANDLWFLVIFSILDALTSFFPFSYLLQLAKRWYALSVSIPGDLEQREANKLFEAANFEYSVRVSKYSKLLMIVLFTNSILPISSLISILYLGIFYWADKIFLLRFARIPQYCTFLLGNEMLKFFDVVLISYTVTCCHKR